MFPQRIRIQLPEKLKPFSNRHKRFKVAIGGRGSGKSTLCADSLDMLCSYGHKIYCLREHKTSISKSVYPLLCSRIKAHKIPGFKILKTEITHPRTGGQIDFGGIARCIEDLKSAHGYTFFWIEEGQFLEEDSIKNLTPTLREKGGELWISANPKNSLDPLSKRFITPFQKELDRYGYYEDDLHLIVKINYIDNPWFPEGLEQERQYDYVHMSRAMYDHVWLGAFNDSVDDSIIIAEWFDAAVDAHKKLGFEPTGVKVLSHDPSDLGDDDKAYVLRHGNVILDARSREFGDVNQGCDWATTTAIENNCDLFIWDSDGMGVSLKRQISDTVRGKHIRIKPFCGSESPDFKHQVYEKVEDETRQKKNIDVFINKRAQYYWLLRDRFFKTYLAVEKGKYTNPEELISICSDVEEIGMLRSEICRIPRIYNSMGKIQIMNKKQMQRLKIQSPNIADSLMMSFMIEKPPANDNPIEFDSIY